MIGVIGYFRLWNFFMDALFLNLLNVFYFIVFSMCADKSNINSLHSNVKPKFCDKSVLVVRNVENNSFVPNIIGSIEDMYHLLHWIKTIGGNNIIPKFQWCFGIGVFFPKNFQSFFRYYPHRAKIRDFSQIGKVSEKYFWRFCIPCFPPCVVSVLGQTVHCRFKNWCSGAAA